MTARLKDIGKEWQTRIKRFFDSPLGADAAPLEICQAILDEIENRVQPLGRGRRVFPFTRLVVRLLGTGSSAATAAERAAALATVPARVRERLLELQCEGKVEVKVLLLKKAPSEWREGQLFAIEYHVDPRGLPAAAAPTPSVQIVVVKGAASSRSYTFTEPVISIGRTADPTDERGQVRRNRVAFLDRVDGITETVGRAHARLRFDPKSGDYHVLDEGSSNGTAVIRCGSAIPVPARDPRGVRIRSGDEVQVGRAVIRIVLPDAGRTG